MINVLKHLITLSCCIGLATVVQAAPLSSGMACSGNTDLFSSAQACFSQRAHTPDFPWLSLSTRQTHQKKIPPFNPFGTHRSERQVIV